MDRTLERVTVIRTTDDTKCPSCGETSGARMNPVSIQAAAKGLRYCLACYCLWRKDE